MWIYNHVIVITVRNLTDVGRAVVVGGVSV